MTDPTLRGRWRAEVYRTRLVGGTVRVTLLRLGDEMRADGYVSVPRITLASWLGVHPRRVTEHLTAAVDVGLLSRVAAGQPRRTAEYRALLPGRSSADARPATHPPSGGADGRTPRRGAVSSTHRGADGRTPQTPFRGAPVQPAKGKRSDPTGDAQTDAPGSSSRSQDQKAPGWDDAGWHDLITREATP